MSPGGPDSTAGADQSRAVAMLSGPATHGVEGPVETVQTHGALVFLAGDRALKIKRAVRYDYLDQSTLERRRALLELELALNAPAAPGLYEAVLPLDAEGRLGGPGEPIEWVLVMRRFPAEAELAVLAERGGLTDALGERIGREVARFHAGCPPREADGAALMSDILDEVAREFAGLSDLLGPDATAFPSRGRGALAAQAPLLRERALAGLVRRAHGDLHLGNLVMLEGRPVPFDALEFDETLGTCDLLYDLAFLLMDLRHRGLPRAANLAMNAWLAAFDPPQEAGLAAMPLFLAVRAAIRAMVEAQAARVADHPAEHAAEGRRYLADALAYLKPEPPRLVALGGPSGSGKSTLARAVAHALGAPPGAVVLRSDVIRKALAGGAPEERLPPEAYGPGTAEPVYAAMRERAAAALRAGRAVILDAVHGRAEERRAAEAVAAAMGVPFDALWIEAPEAALLARVEARRGDASDADATVLRGQLARLGAPDWPRLVNARTAEEGAAALREALRLRP